MRVAGANILAWLPTFPEGFPHKQQINVELQPPGKGGRKVKPADVPIRMPADNSGLAAT